MTCNLDTKKELTKLKWLKRVQWEALVDIVFGFHRDRIRARCSVVVKALCYKPEGRGFKAR
jgi:hypothetical protein